MRRILAILCLLTMTACGTVKSDIAAVQVLLTASERAATAYASLPLCPAPVPCAKTDVLAKIAIADKAAFIAVSAAREAEDKTTLDAARIAVANLNAIIVTFTEEPIK